MLFFPLVEKLFAKGLRKMRAKGGDDAKKRRVLGLNMVNIAVYFVFYMCNKKMDFFENEKFFKLQKKLNESLSAEKSKRFRNLAQLLVRKLERTTQATDQAKDFRDWIQLKLPFLYEDFEVIELRNLIEKSLDFRSRRRVVTVKEAHLSRLTRLICCAERLSFFTDRDPVSRNGRILVADSNRTTRSRRRTKSARSSSRASQRVPKQAQRRRNQPKVGDQLLGAPANEQVSEDEQNAESAASDQFEQEEDESDFQLNNRIFREFVLKLDDECNYARLYRKLGSEREWAKGSRRQMNVEIWDFTLFAYSLEKVKKCNICRSFLPDYLCENALDIVPCFSENRNNRGLIK